MSAFHIHKGQKKRRKWPFYIVGLIFLGIFIVVASVVMWYQQALQPLSVATEQEIVTVTIGETAAQIGETLESKDIIRSARAFEWYVRFNGLRNQLQAGGYKFSPDQSVRQIVLQLVEGGVATDLVTILPAQRLDQIRASLIENTSFTAEEVDEALQAELYLDHPVLTYKPADATLEGYLYPESFQRSSTTLLSDIIRASLDETQQAITTELRDKFSSYGLSVHEAITLASIIEREVSNPAERPLVAQVFLKRYQEGMMLGSDPTALYGALLAGIEPSVFADTPYNTRLYVGLPPGPINNVSVDSLRALAFPADTDYLFFVSGDDGITYFSRTLAEHEALTAQHCIVLCQSY